MPFSGHTVKGQGQWLMQALIKWAQLYYGFSIV